MASISRRGDNWRVIVTKNGQRKSATFSTKSEAAMWGAKIEVEIENSSNGKMPDKTFADLLNRYADEVSVKKRGARWERLRIGIFCNMDIGKVALDKFDEVHVYKWREQRLAQVSESSVNREWCILSNACNVALREWKWLKTNPFMIVKKPTAAPARTRRISDDEIERLLYALGYERDSQLKTKAARTGAALLFAIETAMRAGEIVGMTWNDVKDRYVHLPMTKNGHPRNVPLSSEARRILEQLPKDTESCFNISSQVLDASFRRAKDKALISDLHFHDSRREALSRLAKKFTPMELAKVSGHRDLRILLNTYYAPTADDLADKLD
jgi:integrase